MDTKLKKTNLYFLSSLLHSCNVFRPSVELPPPSLLSSEVVAHDAMDPAPCGDKMDVYNGDSYLLQNSGDQ